MTDNEFVLDDAASSSMFASPRELDDWRLSYFSPARVKVRFTIRETTYYVGEVEIDRADFEAETGVSLEDALEYENEGPLHEYCLTKPRPFSSLTLVSNGVDVFEMHGEIDDQEWSNYEWVV